MKAQIEYAGVSLQVYGDYFKGEAESDDSPGERESFVIQEIVTESGDDITNFVKAMFLWGRQYQTDSQMRFDESPMKIMTMLALDDIRSQIAARSEP